MTDNQLLALLATQLNAAVALAGWMYTPPGSTVALPYPVLQKEQPTQEGIPYSPAVYFEKLFDIPFGFAGVANSFDSETSVMTQTETQNYETTIQISALVIQQPSDLSIPTASDVVNYLKRYMTSRAQLAAWTSQGVNILRPLRVENPYFEDDRHRNEAMPSFDLVFTHQNAIAQPIGYVTDMTGTDIIVGSDVNAIVE
jgi:hypothetical protein